MSSSNCLRPAVPPKPDKDKVLTLSSLSSPTTTLASRGDPSSLSSPLSAGLKQTVGTQVNIINMRQPSPASASGTSTNDTPRVKPALPPKPRPSSALSNSALPSRNSSVQLISVQSPPPPSAPSFNQGKSSTPIKKGTFKADPAPVARIDEFDNLSDLSLSPQHNTSSEINPKVNKPPLRPPPRVFPPSPRSPPPAPPTTTASNRKPDKTVFKFPTSTPPPLVTSPTSKLFTPSQIQIRQAKSASLGRGAVPPTSSSFALANKKSNTLSRVSPLDLSWSPNSQAALLRNRPTNFPRPITFAAESNANSLLPPPPPPRLRKNRLSISSSGTSPTSPISPGLTGTEESQPNSHNQSTHKPVYATVDKEKKWAARLQKQAESTLVNAHHNSSNNIEKVEIKNGSVSPLATSVKTTVTSEQSFIRTDTMEVDSVIKSSLTVTPSWLGRLIDKEETAVTKTPDNSEESLRDPPFDPNKPLPDEPVTEQQVNGLETITSEIVTETTSGEECSSSSIFESKTETINGDLQDNACGELISPNSYSDKPYLCKNESFLFAMQDASVLPIDSNASSDVTEEVVDKSSENTSSLEVRTLSDQVEQKDLSEIASEQPVNPPIDEPMVCQPCDVEVQDLTNKSLGEPTGEELTRTQRASVTSNFEINVEAQLESFNKLSAATFTEYDVSVSALRKKYSSNNPNLTEVLEVADSQLQSVQHLLEDLSKKPKTEQSGLENGLNSQQNVKELKSLEEPRKSDGDVVSALIQTKFQKETPSNSLLIADQTQDEEIRRRSWNTYSDASPSPSESSSSSCSHINQSHVKASHCNCRRKQAGSSWADEYESTGALGDAESSDQVPSSTEDVGSHTNPKMKKKKSSFGIFSSFGKGGAEATANGQRRSQFFVAEDLPSDPSSNSHGVEEKGIELSPHPPLQRASGLFSSVSSAGSFLQVESPESSRSSMRTITPEPPESVPVPFDDILEDLLPTQRKSFFVAREILTSERTFVDVLNLLTEDFPAHLQAISEALRIPILGSKDLEFILGGLPGLKTVNVVLASELERRIGKWRETPKVADIFVKTGPFLKHYATYVRDFERIMQRLDGCCGKYPTFAKAVRDFEVTERCQKLGLKHYMLKPVQRMPQYRLLLEDYLKTLTEESEDYGDTLKAIAIVKEVAEHANEAINLQINAEKLINLQNRLPGTNVLRTNRFLIKEGELRKVCRKELQPRYFALMTDCLLCMTYNASTGATAMKDLKLRYELPLTGMRISASPSEDYFEFSVISNTRSFNLVTKTSRERDEWVKALTNTIQDNIKKRTCTTPDMEKEFRIGVQAPVWIQDKRVTMCQVCTAEFTVTFRRHHCRACGKVVCGNCSSNQAPLRYKSNLSARVCDECYEYLLEEFDKENSERNTSTINEVRSRFKKFGYNTTQRNNKQRRSIPDKFKIQASSIEYQVMGYLQWREKERKPWKRNWFALKDQVLYWYAASEDIVATKTLPVLGYEVEVVTEESAVGEGQLMFKLIHSGQNPITFLAESSSSAEKWIAALQEATVLA